MQSRLGFILEREALHLADAGSDVLLRWVEVTGGWLDAGSGALVSGVSQPMSGIMKGHGMIEPARSVERRYAEIQTGDLILDVASDPDVTLCGGLPTSGVVKFADIEAWQPRFEYGGRFYVQSKVGQELNATWDVVVANRKVGQTLLLRLAT